MRPERTAQMGIVTKEASSDASALVILVYLPLFGKHFPSIVFGGASCFLSEYSIEMSIIRKTARIGDAIGSHIAC